MAWPRKCLKDTHGRLGDPILTPARAQKVISKSTMRVELERVQRGMTYVEEIAWTNMVDPKTISL